MRDNDVVFVLPAHGVALSLHHVRISLQLHRGCTWDTTVPHVQTSARVSGVKQLPWKQNGITV
jgi:hypothetical protein